MLNSFKKHKDLAILLYIYIDRNLAFKEKFEINLKNLFDNLDLSQNYVKYPSQRKMIIEPVLEELESKPLSTGILTYCKVQKTKDDKDYKLVCRKRLLKTLSNKRKGLSEARRDEKISEEEQIEALKMKISAYKANLTDEQKAELREQALTKIKTNKQFKEEFITDMLIEIFENEIIKSKVL